MVKKQAATIKISENFKNSQVKNDHLPLNPLVKETLKIPSLVPVDKAQSSVVSNKMIKPSIFIPIIKADNIKNPQYKGYDLKI